MEKRGHQHLSTAALIASVRQAFSHIRDPVQRDHPYTLLDCLSSGLAVFGLKFPSLLQFDKAYAGDTMRIRHNLQSLYGVEHAPCDTQLRQRLDGIEPRRLGRAYQALLRPLQRGKQLTLFRFLSDFYLVAIDGTGVFHSDTVHCPSCCVKHHRDGHLTYYHQVLSAVLVHPDQKVVLPLMLEPIIKQDGIHKNDCELNACQRLLTQLHHMHPKLPLVIVEDSLYSVASHIEALKSHDYHYILGAKPGNHEWLFDWINAGGAKSWTIKRGSCHYEFRWMNNVPLNSEHDEQRVNFFEVWETHSKGKKQHFSWITDFEVTRNNIIELMKGGRARWRIENETFNTLKNQGYHFEHNFGHGYKTLSTVMAHLMMLAFLIDQIQQLQYPAFQRALKRKGYGVLWVEQRVLWCFLRLSSWDQFYDVLNHDGCAEDLMDVVYQDSS